LLERRRDPVSSCAAWGESLPRASSAPDRFGSSASSLHAKIFGVDDRRVFVGSFNFDPAFARSEHGDGTGDRQFSAWQNS
jgi:phosphatidylserine/phosphatidylglycerophosphate/cardiolipin synthase-like enzyme